jgi:hypothetical protein
LESFSKRKKKKKNKKVEFTIGKPNIKKKGKGNSHFFGPQKRQKFLGEKKRKTLFRIALPSKIKYN